MRTPYSAAEAERVAKLLIARLAGGDIGGSSDWLIAAWVDDLPVTTLDDVIPF